MTSPLSPRANQACAGAHQMIQHVQPLFAVIRTHSLLLGASCVVYSNGRSCCPEAPARSFTNAWRCSTSNVLISRCKSCFVCESQASNSAFGDDMRSYAARLVLHNKTYLCTIVISLSKITSASLLTFGRSSKPSLWR